MPSKFVNDEGITKNHRVFQMTFNNGWTVSIVTNNLRSYVEVTSWKYGNDSSESENMIYTTADEAAGYIAAVCGRKD